MLTSSNNSYVVYYQGGYYRGSALSVRKPVALRAPQGLAARDTASWIYLLTHTVYCAFVCVCVYYIYVYIYIYI